MAVKLSQSISHTQNSLSVPWTHMDRLLGASLKKRQMPLLPRWNWCQGSLLRHSLQGSMEMPHVGVVTRAILWWLAEGQAGLENLRQKVLVALTGSEHTLCSTAGTDGIYP